MFKVVSILVALIFSSMSFASGSVTTKIKSLWVHDKANDVVFLETDHHFQSVCKSGGTNYFVIHLDRTNMKEAYAMALAAVMAGKVVTVGGKDECYVNYEVLQYIKVM